MGLLLLTAATYHFSLVDSFSGYGTFTLAHDPTTQQLTVADFESSAPSLRSGQSWGVLIFQRSQDTLLQDLACDPAPSTVLLLLCSYQFPMEQFLHKSHACEVLISGSGFGNPTSSNFKRFWQIWHFKDFDKFPSTKVDISISNMNYSLSSFSLTLEKCECILIFPSGKNKYGISPFL